MGLSLGFGKSRSSSSFKEKREGSALDIGTSSQQQASDTAKKAATKTSQQQQSSQAGTTTGSQTGTTNAALESQQLTELFSPEVLSQLESQFATSGFDAASLQSFITERAQGADAALSGITDPIIANARAIGERKIGQSTQALARGAGSSLNSVVAQLGLEGQADLERQLASLSATLGLQERQQATEELTAANTAGSGVNVQLANLLKGGTVRTSGTQASTQETAQQSQTQQLTDALSSILGDSSTDEIQSIVQAITGETTNAREVQETSKGFGRAKSSNLSLGLTN